MLHNWYTCMCTMPDPILSGHPVFGRAQNISLVTLVDFL